jgi:hypothetical protein
VILQKTRDAEREQTSTTLERQDNLLTGTAKRIERGGSSTGPHRGRDPARPADPEEMLRVGDRIRVRDQDRPHGQGPAVDPVAIA